MNPPVRLYLLLVLLLGVLSGCASDGIETSVTFDPLASFPAEATYLWDDASNRPPKDPRLVALELGAIITRAAEAELALRGYRLEKEGVPNFLLSYEVAAHSWIGADNSRAVGSVSLVLMDASTGRKVWLGFGQSNVNVGLGPAEREARVRTALARMLEKFPPNQAAPK